jgi:hypothetical protein
LLGGQAAANYTGEHTCRRVLIGEVDDVRRRLIRALERLEYRLLSEQQPLLARRPARRDIMSADMLDVARTIAVGLKANGAAATLATFDIAVVHPWGLGDGDRHTLELEVDALVALAGSPEESGACAACGAENSGEARFCRTCGAPNVFAQPAELELMRLEAGARAAHQEHVFGFVIILVTLAVSLSMILFGRTKVASLGWIVFALGMLLGLAMALYGVRRLHSTLNPKGRKPAPPAPATPEAIPAPRAAAALPPRSARASVTEGTTELLGAVPKEEERVETRLRSKGTNPFD